MLSNKIQLKKKGSFSTFFDRAHLVPMYFFSTTNDTVYSSTCQSADTDILFSAIDIYLKN